MEEGLLEEARREQFSGKEAEPEKKEPVFLEEPPRYLKEEILNRTRQLDVQASVKLKETSRQVQLMIYSLKVGLAVAASIFLLTLTSNVQHMELNLQLQENQQTEQEKGESQQMSQEKGEEQRREESIAGKLRRGSKEITTILNELSSGVFRIDRDTSENKRNQEVTR